MFLEFMKKHGLTEYVDCFPIDMTVRHFRRLGEADFIHDYNIRDVHVRDRLMDGVAKAREEIPLEETDDEVRLHFV